MAREIAPLAAIILLKEDSYLMPKSFLRRLIVPLVVLALLAAFTGVASAQSAGPTTKNSPPRSM